MSTRSVPALALGGALALGVALGLGIATVSLRSEPAPGRSPAAPAVPQAPSDEQIGERAAQILNGKDPLRRVTELSALLSTLGSTAVPALRGAFEAAPLDSADPELALL